MTYEVTVSDRIKSKSNKRQSGGMAEMAKEVKELCRDNVRFQYLYKIEII